MGVLGEYLWGSKKKKDSLFVVEEAGRGGWSLSTKADPPPPQMPQEPMEFLSRSWSLSALELSRVLVAKTKHVDASAGGWGDYVEPPVATAPSQTIGFASPIHHHPCSEVEFPPANRRASSRWFSSWEPSKRRARKKEKDRAERARVHAAISVAGVAAAVAAVSASGAAVAKDEEPRMSTAMASATRLLASHFLEVAERMGAGHDRLANAVRSVVDVRTAGDLLTLTAAAATALRASAALRQRLQREVPWKMATVFPSERFPCGGADVICKKGLLLKRTSKGHTFVHITLKSYISKTSQIVIQLKSKLVGGALSKKETHLVYSVLDDVEAWPRRGRDGEGKGYFGIRTTQGRLIEFECENMEHKKKWVDGIRNLLDQASKNNCTHLEEPLQLMKLN